MIRSLSTLLYGAAALVAVAGLVALGLDLRAAGGAAGSSLAAPVSYLAGAVAQPMALLAAGGWGLFGFLARRLGPARRRPRRRGVPAGGEPKPAATRLDAPEQVAARRGGVERLRLEALLKGREPEVAAFVQRAVEAARDAGASDIHLQLSGPRGVVTFRARGELREAASYPAERHPELVRRLKVLASLPPYVTAEPQDGRLAVDTDGGVVEMRLSTVPSAGGERVALRLAGDAESRRLDQLGLLPRDLERFEDLLDQPQGLVVLTGPTGCGKTTTLYAALGHVHHHRGSSTSIASIEDPVEVELPFAQQVAVDRARGLGFAAALRSVLRQDPNVLMIGEVRDAETAKAAVQAGLSGHLILTTLHAESTLGVFPRLIDLGSEPFLAASATLACLSQRLVPRLCPRCRHPRSLSAEARRELAGLDLGRGEDSPSVLADADFYTAEGCAACGRSGVDGRVAVFELLVVDAELRRAITARRGVDALREVAARGGAVFFEQSALRLAAAGEIALDEARRFALGPP